MIRSLRTVIWALTVSTAFILVSSVIVHAGGSHGGQVIQGLTGPGQVSDFYRYRASSIISLTAVALLAASIVIISIRKFPLHQPGRGIKVLSGERLKGLADWAPFPLILQLPAAFFFIGIIYAGLAGNSFAVLVTWGIWWALLPFGVMATGRAWCLACPIGAVADGANRLFRPDRHWPAALKSLWPQIGLFILLTWSFLYFRISERPGLTALLLASLALASLAMGTFFKGRAFCRYLCPIGGLIGIYSRVAPVELRRASGDVCDAHETKECAFRCPWHCQPYLMESSNNCNLCLKCASACSRNNLRLSLRSPLKELRNLAAMRPDESALAFALFGVLLYELAVMVVPRTGPASGPISYSLYYVLFTILVPAALFIVGSLGRGKGLMALFATLIPITLSLHLAHNLEHITWGLPAISSLAVLTSELLQTSWGVIPSGISYYSLFKPVTLLWLQMGLILSGLAISVLLMLHTGVPRSRAPRALIMVANTLLIVIGLYFLGLPMPGATPAAESRRALLPIAFVSDRVGPPELFLMGPQGDNQVRLTFAGADEGAWSPDGKLIAFTSRSMGNRDIYLYDVVHHEGSPRVGTGSVRQLTFSSADDWGPIWSPDGRFIAFVSGLGPSAEIYLIGRDGEGVKRLTYNRSWDYVRSWSPDGSRLLLETDRDGSLAVYSMMADGSNQLRLTSNRSNDADPAYSPDGRQIVFSSDRDRNREIYVMDSDGTNQRRLTSNPAWDGHPYWSPEGSRILFESSRGPGGSFEIVTMFKNGARQVSLTRNRYDDRHPSWSPDGLRVIFESLRGERTQIYVINADGTEERSLKAAPGNNYHPSW